MIRSQSARDAVKETRERERREAAKPNCLPGARIDRGAFNGADNRGHRSRMFARQVLPSHRPIDKPRGLSLYGRDYRRRAFISGSRVRRRLIDGVFPFLPFPRPAAVFFSRWSRSPRRSEKRVERSLDRLFRSCAKNAGAQAIANFELFRGIREIMSYGRGFVGYAFPGAHSTCVLMLSLRKDRVRHASRLHARACATMLIW